MYPSVLQYQFITPYTYCQSYCSCVGQSPLYNWLMFGKLPVSNLTNPRYSTQVVTAGAPNRYLASVTIPRIPVVLSTVTLAAAAVATYTFKEAATAVSSNPAFATVTVSNEVVTITGVAAGTTTITISDANSNTIAVITVTVA